MSDKGFEYAPGSALGIVVWPIGVLIDLRPDDPLVGAIYESLHDSRSLDALLDILAAGGVTKMPAFAVAHQLEGGQTRVLARGEVVARCRDDSEIKGSGVFTDITVSSDTVSVLEAGKATKKVVFPVSDAVVMASTIVVNAAPVESSDSVVGEPDMNEDKESSSYKVPKDVAKDQGTVPPEAESVTAPEGASQQPEKSPPPLISEL